MALSGVDPPPRTRAFCGSTRLSRESGFGCGAGGGGVNRQLQDRGLVVALTSVGAGAVVHVPSIGAVDRSLVLAHGGTTLLALDAQIRDQEGVTLLTDTERCSSALLTNRGQRTAEGVQPASPYRSWPRLLAGGRVHRLRLVGRRHDRGARPRRPVPARRARRPSEWSGHCYVRVGSAANITGHSTRRRDGRVEGNMHDAERRDLLGRMLGREASAARTPSRGRR